MIEEIMKKIGDELRVNPTINYSPSLNNFQASVPDVSLQDIHGKHLPNFIQCKTAEDAVINLYLILKKSIISVYGYPMDEEYAYVGGRFERVYEVNIDTTEPPREQSERQPY